MIDVDLTVDYVMRLIDNRVLDGMDRSDALFEVAAKVDEDLYLSVCAGTGWGNRERTREFLTKFYGK